MLCVCVRVSIYIITAISTANLLKAISAAINLIIRRSSLNEDYQILRRQFKMDYIAAMLPNSLHALLTQLPMDVITSKAVNYMHVISSQTLGITISLCLMNY